MVTDCVIKTETVYRCLCVCWLWWQEAAGWNHLVPGEVARPAVRPGHLGTGGQRHRRHEAVHWELWKSQVLYSTHWCAACWSVISLPGGGGWERKLSLVCCAVLSDWMVHLHGRFTDWLLGSLMNSLCSPGVLCCLIDVHWLMDVMCYLMYCVWMAHLHGWVIEWWIHCKVWCAVLPDVSCLMWCVV